MEKLSVDNYNLRTWSIQFSDCKVELNNVHVHETWNEMFTMLFNDKRYTSIIKEELSKKLGLDKNIEIYPYPELVFNAFKLTSLNKLKVVILGQDPYFDSETHNDIDIPQAMGLSFSVPYGMKIPSSLRNIFSNLKKYKHIENIPTHGNLESWAKQGCLLLNTSLTVKKGSKNCHQYIWSWFTDKIISYIAENKDKVIFVLWGSNALEKIDYIDQTKHKMIISSHPSGLSAGKSMKSYPAFNAEDHFGKINQQLKEWNSKEINWEI